MSGSHDRRIWRGGHVDVLTAAGERHRIELDAEQQLGALPVVADLAAHDGAVQIDA
jgi:hypothetical protein